MATFSIISRDDPADDLLEAEVVPVTQEHIDQALESLSRDVAALGSIDDESLPPLLMELPDLTVMGQWSEQRWSNWGNRIFWVGIVLGSIVALYLIWLPRRPLQPQREAAPTWHGQSAPASDSTAEPAPPSNSVHAHEADHARQAAPAHQHFTPREQAAAPAWPAESEPRQIQPIENNVPPTEQESAPPVPTAPAFDEWSAGRPAGSPVYTARGGETRMDGGAPSASAGEAVPTGKIKSVVTP